MTWRAFAILGGAVALWAGAAAAQTDPAASFRQALALAKKGDRDAQCALGAMYHAGEGTAQDPAEAVRWYRKAAEQGQSTAQYRLALCLEQGDGIGRDASEAVR
jgi:TPR repeat protein